MLYVWTLETSIDGVEWRPYATSDEISFEVLLMKMLQWRDEEQRVRLSYDAKRN